jgi:ABC-type bacteriocin/lantibiotic exporter with double-glycine peptidase domain
MTTDQTIIQLDEYYKLNIQHLRWSFTSSLAALFAGLMALLVGIFLVIDGNYSLTGQLIVIGGIITQFVGAGFFALYSRNLTQLNVFYDKLIRHKDTLYAISLAREVPEPDKSKAILAVVGNLLSRGEPPIPPEVLTRKISV